MPLDDVGVARHWLNPFSLERDGASPLLCRSLNAGRSFNTHVAFGAVDSQARVHMTAECTANQCHRCRMG